MIYVPDQYEEIVFSHWDDDIFDWLLKEDTVSRIKNILPDLISIQPSIYDDVYFFECKVGKKNSVDKVVLYNKGKKLVIGVIQRNEVDNLSDHLDRIRF